MFNPRDTKQLEHYLTIQSYPPYDIAWVECGLEAIAAIDKGNPQQWINLPVEGHQLTAEDITKFLHIDNHLTVAESTQ